MNIITEPEYTEKAVIDIECGYPQGVQGITLVVGQDELRETETEIQIIAGPGREEVRFYKAHLCWSRITRRTIKIPKDPRPATAAHPANAITASIQRVLADREGLPDPSSRG